MDTIINIVIIAIAGVCVLIIRLFIAQKRRQPLQKFAMMNNYEFNNNSNIIDDLTKKQRDVMPLEESIPQDIVSFTKGNAKIFIFNRIGTRNLFFGRGCLIEMPENISFHILVVYSRRPLLFKNIIPQILTRGTDLQEFSISDPGLREKIYCFCNKLDSFDRDKLEQIIHKIDETLQIRGINLGQNLKWGAKGNNVVIFPPRMPFEEISMFVDYAIEIGEMLRDFDRVVKDSKTNI